MKVIEIISAFLLVFSFGCKNNEKNTCMPTANFIKDVPVVHGKLALGYVYGLEISDQLNLPDISNGYDSLQIRVWFPTEKDGNQKLLILDRKAGKWNLKMCKFLADYSNRIPEVISTEKLNARLRYSWNDLIHGIDKIKILEIKDFRQIENYNDNFTHPGYYTFEIATCTFYRFFESVAPEENSAIPEAKKVLEFIELIKKHVEY